MMSKTRIRPHAPSGLIRNEPVIRIVALTALVWGAVYLGWRAVETWDRTDPALFLLLYACELFGWAMLASFCFLAWRIPASTRPPISRQHSVDVLVCTYDEGPEPPGGHAPWLCRDHLPERDVGARRRPPRVRS